MKPFLAIVGGFVVSLGMFVSGAAVATYFLAVEPVREPDARQDVAALWTPQPRPVDQEAQDFERAPAIAPGPEDDGATQVQREMQVAMANTGSMNDSTAQTIDTMSTGSVHEAEGVDREPSKPENRLSAAHVAWCSDNYRSYRPETNSYTPYSGGQRPCVSPYSEGLSTSQERVTSASDAEVGVEPVTEQPSQELQYAAGAPAETFLSYEHVQDCMSRYRSYRPEDNTYQPYGGGPRKQCR